MSVENTDHEVVAHDLASRIIRTFTGEAEDRILDKPSRALFIGTVGPIFNPQNHRSRFSPPAEVGMEFLLAKRTGADAHIDIRLMGAYYFRVFPTLREHVVGAGLPPETDVEETEEEGGDEDEGTVETAARELAVVFQKAGPISVDCSAEIAQLMGKNLGREVTITGGDELAKRAKALWTTAGDDRYRTRGGSAPTSVERQQLLRVPPEALRDNGTFDDYVRAMWRGRLPEPAWSTTVVAKAEEYDTDTLRITVVLRNSAKEDRSCDDIDNSIYETHMNVHVKGAEITPIVLDELRDDYRFDGKVPGKGINCTVVGVQDGLAIEHAPVYIQHRYVARLFDGPGTSLKELSYDPLPGLGMLVGAMKQALAGMERQLAEEGPNHSARWRLGFTEDVEAFRRDVERVETSLSVLVSVPEALEAFKLMNLAFSTSRSPFQHWRRFQLIFALLQVPDAVAVHKPNIKNFRNVVDVIYFPTGGGKTEAYLSTVVFQMFFDRLMKKKSGVSAITKFPLRLLSLQQIQRIADVFGAAEAIRREHPVIGAPGNDPFSTGYFVGDKNTPNRVLKQAFRGEEGEDNLRRIEENGVECVNWRVIPVCPFPGCGGAVKLEADRSRIRIVHRCTKCNLEVPVYITDDEVFRYLPTLVVSTLDKSTVASFQRYFRQIYGVVSGRCQDHGYFSGPQCMYAWNGNGPCKRTDHEKGQLSDPAPALLIQDEIHLVRESLGSYDSHYETFLDTLQQSLDKNGKRTKIIAASATVSQLRRHLHHLYMREGAKFPSHGPNAKDSFYAREEDKRTARIIVGILPRITPIFSVLHLIRVHRQLDARVMPPVEESPQASKVASDYSLALCYNLKKMEADEVANSVRRQVNRYLRASGIPAIEPEVLTGDVGFGDVRELMDRIQHPTPEDRPSLVVSTSAISHGVDLDSLNFMIFHGMPSNTAEYVQAYSRVGRKYPGIVFVVFNPWRERDMSHYRNFQKYHEVTDLLIEPVPINRWAKFSVNRTMPGIFAASVLNYFEPLTHQKGVRRLYMLKDFAEALNRGDLSEQEILKFIKLCYRVNEDPEGTHFSKVIEERVAAYVNATLQAYPGGEPTFLPMALPDPPMINLRDTDIPVEISANSESFHAMRTMRRSP